MAVQWRVRALADVKRIVAYVAVDNPEAARQIGQELLVAGDSLAVFPRRGRPASQLGMRELTAVRPYIIVYRVADDDTVTIVRVWHAAQNRL